MTAKRRLTPIERAAAGVHDGSYTPAPTPKRRKSGHLAPTPYWLDQVKSGVTLPPPADHTPMLLCESGQKQCGKFYPFYYGRGCACTDCLNVLWLQRERAWRDFEGEAARETLADELPPELPPQAAAQAELEQLGGKVPEAVLPSDREDLLTLMVLHFEATGEIVEIFSDGTCSTLKPSPIGAIENR
jgi:hypothetical protein